MIPSSILACHRVVATTVTNHSRHCTRARFGGKRSLGTVASNETTSPTSTTEKQRLATIRLYRILQRTCRSFPAKDTNEPILLQRPLQPNEWGRHVVFQPPTPTIAEEVLRLFYVTTDEVDEPPTSSPSNSDVSIDEWYHQVVGHHQAKDLPPLTSLTCWTSIHQLQEAVRLAFRLPYQVNETICQTSLHYWAIRAIQMLKEQQIMWKNSSVATTDGVRVTATSRCIGTTSPVTSAQQPSTKKDNSATTTTTTTSSILETKLRFAYRIRIENSTDSPTAVQLLGRYWHIQDLNHDGSVDETKPPVIVDSPTTGAVGQLPVLQPGQVFEYMSGTDMANPKGVMRGHFYMARVPSSTHSARAGDYVQALDDDDDEDDDDEEEKVLNGEIHDKYYKFEVAVAPLPLETN